MSLPIALSRVSAMVLENHRVAVNIEKTCIDQSKIGKEKRLLLSTKFSASRKVRSGWMLRMVAVMLTN